MEGSNGAAFGAAVVGVFPAVEGVAGADGVARLGVPPGDVDGAALFGAAVVGVVAVVDVVAGAAGTARFGELAAGVAGPAFFGAACAVGAASVAPTKANVVAAARTPTARARRESQCRALMAPSLLQSPMQDAWPQGAALQVDTPQTPSPRPAYERVEVKGGQASGYLSRVGCIEVSAMLQSLKCAIRLPRLVDQDDANTR
jgi:hypothetical protein